MVVPYLSNPIECSYPAFELFRFRGSSMAINPSGRIGIPGPRQISRISSRASLLVPLRIILNRYNNHPVAAKSEILTSPVTSPSLSLSTDCRVTWRSPTSRISEAPLYHACSFQIDFDLVCELRQFFEGTVVIVLFDEILDGLNVCTRIHACASELFSQPDHHLQGSRVAFPQSES